MALRAEDLQLIRGGLLGPEALVPRGRALPAVSLTLVPVRQNSADFERVDFAAIKRNTDYVTRAANRTLANLIARAAWRILGDQMRLAELLDQDVADIGTLTLLPSDVNKLRAACSEALGAAWLVGVQQARREARKVVAEAPRASFHLPGQHDQQAHGRASVAKAEITSTLKGYARFSTVLNKGLRQKRKAAATDPRVGIIDAAFEQLGALAEAEQTVYRGVAGNNALTRALKKGEIAAGTTIEDGAFLSTTSSAKTATEVFADRPGYQVVMHLKVPVGMRHLRLGGSEREMLFPRGTRMRVTRVVPMTDEYMGRVEAELLPPASYFAREPVWVWKHEDGDEVIETTFLSRASFHLPGQHDQQTHAGDRTAADPTEPKGFNAARWRAMSMGDRRKAWAELSREERDAAGDPRTTVNARADELLDDADTEWPDTGNPIEDIATYVDSLELITTTEARRKLEQYGTQTLTQLEGAGVKPAEARELALEMTRMIAAQDVEAAGRTLGDHGVHHILQDQKLALDTLAVMPGYELDPKTAAAMSIAVALHDSGYLAPPAREFLDADHGRWSAQYYMEHYHDRVAAALGEDAARFVAEAIAAHDSTVVDWERQPELSAIALADNLALFHAEKMPPMIRYVPANMKPLIALGQGRISVDAAKAQMRANIARSNLAPTLRERMLSAVEEVSPFLPKFTVGMVGASLDRVTWAGDHPTFHITRRASNEALSKVLDMGQQQFRKLAETYRQSPEEFLRTGHLEAHDAEGHVLFEADIERAVRAAMAAAFEAALAFHLPGQHEQQDHAGGRAAKDEVTAYHGTLNMFLSSIREHGLSIKEAANNRMYIDEFYALGKGRAVSTYLTTDLTGAKIYAMSAASAAGMGRPVVLELRVPRAEFESRAVKDEMGAGGDVRMLGDVPAEWIVGWRDARRDDGKLHKFAAAEDAVPVYLVVLVDEDERDDFHLQGQHNQQTHAGDDAEQSGIPKGEDRQLRVEAHAWDGTSLGYVDVLLNPTPAGLKRWAGRDTEAVRYLVDTKTGDVIVWDSGFALHDHLIKEFEFHGLKHLEGSGGRLDRGVAREIAAARRLKRVPQGTKWDGARLDFHLPGQHDQSSHAGDYAGATVEVEGLSANAEVLRAASIRDDAAWPPGTVTTVHARNVPDGRQLMQDRPSIAVEVIKSPTQRELNRWGGGEVSEVRWSVDYKSGNYAIWDANASIHAVVMGATGFDGGFGDMVTYASNSENETPLKEAIAAIEEQVRNDFDWDHISLQARDRVLKRLKREGYTRLDFATDLREKAAGYFEANGFRMAQNLSDGARALIQQELTRAVRTGETGSEVSGRIYRRLVERGFTDLEGVETEVDDEAVLADLLDLDDPDRVPGYLNTLVRTNVFEAMNEARFAEFTDPALDGYVVALEYSAILDDVTTEFCRHMDGRVYAADNEIWDTHRPPNHYNCRSVLIPITQLSNWDGEESEPPAMEPAVGFARCNVGHVHTFHLPGQHEQASHAGGSGDAEPGHQLSGLLGRGSRVMNVRGQRIPVLVNPTGAELARWADEMFAVRGFRIGRDYLFWDADEGHHQWMEGNLRVLGVLDKDAKPTLLFDDELPIEKMVEWLDEHGHRAKFHLPGQHEQQSHAGKDQDAITSESGVRKVAEAFGTMPETTHAGGAGAKAWRKAHDALYTSDPEFRKVADAVTFYTQGLYEPIRERSAIAAGGELQPMYKDTWFERNGNEALSPGMYIVKPYFSGQTALVEGKGATTYAEAGRALNAAIEASAPTTAPLYRGLYGQKAHEVVAALKPGDEFEVRGATSFTRSKTIGEKFSAGMAGGAGGQEMRGYRTLIEVLPGARALNVAALSPWKQSEALTRGKFVVDSVTVSGDPYSGQGALAHVKVKAGGA